MSYIVHFLMRAPIQVEHIIREENMMAAQEIMELFCELIAVRLPIIESQRYSRVSFFFFLNKYLFIYLMYMKIEI